MAYFGSIFFADMVWWGWSKIVFTFCNWGTQKSALTAGIPAISDCDCKIASMQLRLPLLGALRSHQCLLLSAKFWVINRANSLVIYVLPCRAPLTVQNDTNIPQAPLNLSLPVLWLNCQVFWLRWASGVWAQDFNRTFLQQQFEFRVQVKRVVLCERTCFCLLSLAPSKRLL